LAKFVYLQTKLDYILREQGITGVMKHGGEDAREKIKALRKKVETEDLVLRMNKVKQGLYEVLAQQKEKEKT